MNSLLKKLLTKFKDIGTAIVRLITDGTCHVNIEKDKTSVVLR